MGCTGSRPAAAEPVQAPTSANKGAAPEAAPPAPLTTASVAADPSVSHSLASPAAEHSPPAAEGASAVASSEDVMAIVSRTAGKGVPAVLKLMKENAVDAVHQWWCCDAIAGLCAGNERCRAEVVEGGGLSLVLDAMQRFPWDGNVQMKANWLIAIMASNYAAALGEQGAVEMAIAGMRACEEDYQVQTSGIRCLQNLITGNADNRARAKAAGAIKLLEDSLERNPEDGQLQYRGAALLERLNAVEAATVAKVAETDRKLKTGASSARLVGTGSFSVRAQSKGAEADSGRVRTSDSTGSGAGAMPAAAARTLPGGITPTKVAAPGLTPVASRVAERLRADGLRGVIDLMRAEPSDSEVARWGCDALYTTMLGNPEARARALEAGVIELVVARMAADSWHEDLQLKACWVLLALAPTHGGEIGERGGVEAVVTGMQRNTTAHDLQVAAVKLLSLLTLDPTGANLKRARLASAITVVKAVVRAHTEDGTLQYRGINLLERLEPGCTVSMAKVNMVRSASMRAEEMVLGLKSFARQASSRNPASSSRGIAGGVSDAEVRAANAAAIAEVDELAELVEEGDSDAEGAAPGGARKPAAPAAAAGGTKHPPPPPPRLTTSNAEHTTVGTASAATATASARHAGEGKEGDAPPAAAAPATSPGPASLPGAVNVSPGPGSHPSSPASSRPASPTTGGAAAASS